MLSNITKRLCNAVAFSNAGNLNRFHNLLEHQEPALTGGADDLGALSDEPGEHPVLFCVIPNKRTP